MSVRERKRERKQKETEERRHAVPAEEPDVEATLPPIEMEPEALSTDAEVVVQHPHQPTTSATEVKVPLPQWGGPDESEWMYQIPVRKEDIEMWTEEWADYVLEWAEATGTHVISVGVFIKEEPFKHLLNKGEVFKRIAEALVAKDLAEWMDKKRKQLRVYWRPLEDWVDIIYAWAIETGNVRMDVKSLVIQHGNTDFATLPEKDLHKIMAMLVERGLAEWVDRSKGAIVITI